MLTIDPITPALARRGDLGNANEQRAQLAFKEMERLFLNILLKEMKKTVPEGTLFPKSASSRHFEEMLDDVLSFQMAQTGQLGIAKVLEEQYGKSLERIQALPVTGQGQDPAPQSLQ